MADILSRWFTPPAMPSVGLGAKAVREAFTLAYWAGVKDGAIFAAVAFVFVMATVSLLRGKR